MFIYMNYNYICIYYKEMRDNVKNCEGQISVTIKKKQNWKRLEITTMIGIMITCINDGKQS